MAIEPKTLKGFRDFLPKDMRKRNYVLDALKKVFDYFDFEPLETPALEYEEILLGKYGEEGDKLMYRFEDNGGRKIALRYDQTIPLARVYAQYQNELPLPFSRYQTQTVWRAENTQKGRYREFLQCDIDIIGSPSPSTDAKVIMTGVAALKMIGFKQFRVLINDRSMFEGFSINVIRSLDKLKKIGKEKVVEEIVLKDNIRRDEAESIFEKITNTNPPERIESIIKICKDYAEGVDLKFEPTLARGMDYYTSTIFEIEVDGYDSGSIAGGGRYDKLIGLFSNTEIPAVGLSFGFDRLIEAMELLNITFELEEKKLMIATMPEFAKKSVEIANSLRERFNINPELFSDFDLPLEKILRYADKKRIPLVLIVGEKLELKNMKTGEKKEVTIDSLPDALR